MKGNHILVVGAPYSPYARYVCAYTVCVTFRDTNQLTENKVAESTVFLCGFKCVFLLCLSQQVHAFRNKTSKTGHALSKIASSPIVLAPDHHLDSCIIDKCTPIPLCSMIFSVFSPHNS